MFKSIFILIFSSILFSQPTVSATVDINRISQSETIGFKILATNNIQATQADILYDLETAQVGDNFTIVSHTSLGGDGTSVVVTFKDNLSEVVTGNNIHVIVDASAGAGHQDTIIRALNGIVDATVKYPASGPFDFKILAETVAFI